MKKLGFVFSSAPHGSASGREGLDAVLATSNYSEDLVLFFVGDGVLQLLAGQSPGVVLCRDYISTFKMLSLCDVEEIYVCKDSLTERGLGDVPLIIDAKKVSTEDITVYLGQCIKVLNF
ncbi:sulfurtransferase complex subunit TusC [Enterovibrio nigricans]|uniref:Protein TusC homolog n=1 Tax=Enterovibrio nigricans DSM 22720 TaxID=1121868 RepID=A0A1T4U8V9_9GAMM|nr:sulfurtransferase complex subunit TusC [Enterovibrio nigricans]PKF51513.1 sulfurtransferase complex subunit TusC [Enterovibrio nigricans]SKA48958.1 tRNA 2-thiouridine synthesizing protein C [Enterovibrio nigricans DSM 22720]